MAGHYVPSLLAAIGDVIERHLIAIGFMNARETLGVPVEIARGHRRGHAGPDLSPLQQSHAHPGRRLRHLSDLRLLALRVMLARP